ncbi:mCG145133, partial [Mus musculus]
DVGLPALAFSSAWGASFQHPADLCPHTNLLSEHNPDSCSRYPLFPSFSIARLLNICLMFCLSACLSSYSLILTPGQKHHESSRIFSMPSFTDAFPQSRTWFGMCNKHPGNSGCIGGIEARAVEMFSH